MKMLLIGIAALAGLTIPIQGAANAQLNKGFGQVALAGFVIYAVASCGLLLCVPFLHVSLRGVSERVAGIPWWAWTGGLCNLVFVLAAALTTQRIGAATFTVTILSAAVILSVLLDHFGLLGLPQHPLSLMRGLGAILAIGGVVVVSRF